MPDGEYGEVHHIVPKSEGGSDEPDNLVKLTAREHYVAHLLLARIYNDEKMWLAVLLMSSARKNYRVNSRMYAKSKIEASKIISKRQLGRKHSIETRNKISQSNKGKQISKQSRQKISKSLIGHIPWNKNKKSPSPSKETRCKMSIAHMGIQPNKGRKWSDEYKRKMSESLKQLVWITDGVHSTKIRKGETPPSGWYFGRKKKKEVD